MSDKIPSIVPLILSKPDRAPFWFLSKPVYHFGKNARISALWIVLTKWDAFRLSLQNNRLSFCLSRLSFRQNRLSLQKPYLRSLNHK
ncbi:hypothetical protein HOE425_340345 [Hoeflea sp. EC-HK425]|nr:hypothetical protein HOE425_340345 [Hoeflea sp. EC-HK425]